MCISQSHYFSLWLTSASHRFDDKEFEVVGEHPYFAKSTTVRFFVVDRQPDAAAEIPP